MNISFKKLTASDQPFLWEMLYQAIYVPPGKKPYPRSILNQPKIKHCVENWGQPGDIAISAIDTEKGIRIGAVWLRLYSSDDPGFAYIDDVTPELGIAVFDEYRNKGIGSLLMHEIFNRAKNQYKAVCLSVSKGNKAINLYKRLGFEILREDKDSITMKKSLT